MQNWVWIYGCITLLFIVLIICLFLYLASRPEACCNLECLVGSVIFWYFIVMLFAPTCRC